MKKTVKDLFKVFALILVAFVILFTVTVIFQSVAGATRSGLSAEQTDSYSGAVGTLAAGIAVAVFSQKKSGKDLNDRRKKIGPEMFIIAIVATCAVNVLLEMIVGLGLSRFFPVEAHVSSKSNILDYIITIIAAPVSEELMFRKGLYGYSRDKMPRWVAIIALSLLFAVIHGYNVQGFICTFAAGLVLTIIFEKTGNVWYSIFTHMVFNLFSGISNLLAKNGYGIFTEINGYCVYNWGINLAAAAIVCAYAVFCLRSGREKSVQNTCS